MQIPPPLGRRPRDTSSLSEAQIRLIEAKKKYDADRYARISNREKYGSVGHHVKMSKKALARRKAPGHAATTRLMEIYKWNAKVREIGFHLTREQFQHIIGLPCDYCGSPPTAIKRGKDIWSPLIYNGIDRVDNSLGYTSENSVPCCKMCNAAKKAMPVQEFLDWIKRIYHHRLEIRQ